MNENKYEKITDEEYAYANEMISVFNASTSAIDYHEKMQLWPEQKREIAIRGREKIVRNHERHMRSKSQPFFDLYCSTGNFLKK